jgi:hypothetical protein
VIRDDPEMEEHTQGRLEHREHRRSSLRLENDFGHCEHRVKLRGEPGGLKVEYGDVVEGFRAPLVSAALVA